MIRSLDFETRLRTPFGAIVCGPTMSGKSEFIFRLIKEKDSMIDNPPTRIVYCYGQHQPKFDELERECLVEFYHGLEQVLDFENFFNPKVSTLLIIDDLSQSVANDRRCSKLFTQGIHHKNVSVILILQNLYTQGKFMRDIQLNTQYFILYKNCRDTQQIETMARQSGLKELPLAYRQVTDAPYTPLLIDMKPDTPDYLRLRKGISLNDNISFFVGQGKSTVKKPCPTASKG